MIAAVKTRIPDVAAEVAIVFATAEYGADALAAAQESGIPLLRVVDGRSAFDLSGSSGGTPGHYPIWLPAYVAQLVDRDVAGQPRARLLEAGRSDLILDSFRVGSST